MPDTDDKDYATPPEKVTRNAFLYFDPHTNSNKAQFAQCSTCRMFVPAKYVGEQEKQDRCIAHGSKVAVAPTASCGVYLIWPNGKPVTEVMNAHGMELAVGLPGSVTPEESGLVDRPVRCENCYFFDAEESECELFEDLTEQQPDVFDLDKHVHPLGCCNANTELYKRKRKRKPSTVSKRADKAHALSSVTASMS